MNHRREEQRRPAGDETATARDFAWLQSILDAINVSLLVIGRDGMVKRMNRAATRWSGRSMEPNGGVPPGDLIGCAHALTGTEGCGRTPQCADCPIRETFQTVLELDRPVRDVAADATLLVNGNRTRVSLEVSAEPLAVDGQRFAVLALNDVTARREAEEGLLRSEERYRTLLDTAPDAIIVHREGKFLYANPAALRLYGAASLEQLASRELLDLVAPAFRRLTAERLERAIQGDKVPLVENRILRLDGGEVPIEAIGAPITFQGMPAIQAVIRDISERKQAAELLRRSHDDLERRVRQRTEELNKANQTLQMISGCNQIMVRARDETELIREICNEIVKAGGYLMAWVGYAETNAEKTVRPIAAAGLEEGYLRDVSISWDDVERGRGPTGSCIRTGRIQYGRNFLTEPNLAVWRDAALRRGFRSSIAIPLSTDRAVLGALTIYAGEPEYFDSSQASLLQGLADDLTLGILSLRAHQERDNARAVAELQAQQLRTLASALIDAEQRERRRLAKVLHDHLQQLLVGAKLNASTIRASVAKKSLRHLADELSGTIDEAIRASGNLTAELSPPVLHEKGLLAGLHWLARQMERSHGLVIDVLADDAAEPAQEQARALLFESVRELLLNVVKHARIGRAGLEVRLHPAGGIKVVVTDQGAGFDPQALQKIDLSLGGNYGLFSIRERLSYLGGRMEIDSAPGRGSRFTLIAPVALRTVPDEAARPAAEGRGWVRPAVRAEAEEGRTGAKEPPTGRSSVIRVLVVDDHPVVRQGLVRLLLEQDDLEIVGEAADGEEAVRLADELNPDVVLMDVTMPRVDGFEATRRIASRRPGIRVIGLSMHEDETMASAMSRSGAAAYLTKGGPTEELIATIRALLPKRTPED